MNFNRRDFLTGAGAFLAADLPLLSSATGVPPKPLDLRDTTIAVGAQRPFSAYQVSDTHIVRVDTRDTDEKARLAARRGRFSLWGEHYLDATIARAKAEDALLLHTGDLIDFVSEANLDLASGHLSDGDWIASCGNHEFSRFVGEAREDAAYKQGSFDRVQKAFPNELTFASRIINGVNFVVLDDVYYNVTEEQHARFEAEVKKGLPIVLLCHVPFYTPKLADFVMKAVNNKCAYVTGAPDALVDTYLGGKNETGENAWRSRAVQQRADKSTREFVRWLHEQKLLKAILCGHLHYHFEEPFSATATQYVCAATFKGMARAISFT